MSEPVLDDATRPDPVVVDGAAGDGPGRRRVAPFVALAVAIAIGALFVVLAGGDSSRNEAVSSYFQDKPAPTAVGTTLDGRPFDLSRRKGSWVVLNFFDPDCAPCVAEHPELLAFAEQQAELGQGAELYTIINRGSQAQDADDDVVAFFADNGVAWPVVSDPTGSISAAFGVAQVPETWVVDPQGIVRQRFIGEVTAAGLGASLQQFREGAVG